MHEQNACPYCGDDRFEQQAEELNNGEMYRNTCKGCGKTSIYEVATDSQQTEEWLQSQ